jgi:hypothetical protein
MKPTTKWQIDARQVLVFRSSTSSNSNSSGTNDAVQSSFRRRFLPPVVLLLKEEEDHHVPRAAESATAVTTGLGSVVIDTIKWLTVAACLTRYFLNPSILLLLQEQFYSLTNSDNNSGGGGSRFISVVDYPSRQHSQFRLMVAGYVTARVVLSSLQPQFSLLPTPNVQF